MRNRIPATYVRQCEYRNCNQYCMNGHVEYQVSGFIIVHLHLSSTYLNRSFPKYTSECFTWARPPQTMKYGIKFGYFFTVIVVVILCSTASWKIHSNQKHPAYVGDEPKNIYQDRISGNTSPSFVGGKE